MASADGRLVSAPETASAATKSLTGTLNRDTLSAATARQLETARAAPTLGNSAGLATSSALDTQSGLDQSTKPVQVCAGGIQQCH